jgi:S-formylglutathione hydrolase
MTPKTAISGLLSAISGEVVGLYQNRSVRLPLLIQLHGGGSDRNMLTDMAPNYERMFEQGTLLPIVTVSFSSGEGSYYYGLWEQWVTDELSAWANETYGASLDPAQTVMMGVSMGGYGSLKIGFKNPRRFRAIAPMEPAIMPALEWPEQHSCLIVEVIIEGCRLL